MGAPAGKGIAEDSQTHHRFSVAVVQAVIVDIHALSERRLGLALHLDMYQHQVLLAVAAIDPDELVHQPPAKLGIAHHLLQLLVEEFIAPRPVDVRVGKRKEERHELGKVMLQGLFPGTIKVGHRHRPNTFSSIWASSPACSACPGKYT
jgi:hypothetical protein